MSPRSWAIMTSRVRNITMPIIMGLTPNSVVELGGRSRANATRRPGACQGTATAYCETQHCRTHAQVTGVWAHSPARTHERTRARGGALPQTAQRADLKDQNAGRTRTHAGRAPHKRTHTPLRRPHAHTHTRPRRPHARASPQTARAHPRRPCAGAHTPGTHTGRGPGRTCVRMGGIAFRNTPDGLLVCCVSQ